MLSTSLIQLSVDGEGCIPSLLFDLRLNYDGGNEDIGDLLQKALCMLLPHTLPLAQQQATTNPHLCQRLLDTHRQLGVSLLWGHCSLLLGSGTYRVLFVPSKSLFPQSCGSSVIKFHWLPKSNSLGILSSFARAPSWEVCCAS